MKTDDLLEQLVKTLEKIEQHLFIIAKVMDTEYYVEPEAYEWELTDKIHIEDDYHWREEYQPMLDYIDSVFNLTPDFYLANNKYTFNFEDTLRFEKDCQEALLFYNEILSFFNSNGFKIGDKTETDNYIIVKTFVKLIEN